MASQPLSNQSSPRALLEHLATLSDDTTCRAVNLHGAVAEQPPWLAQLFSDVRGDVAPLDLLVDGSQHDVFVAFAASRQHPHVVTAARFIAEPNQLRELHMVVLPADDADGTGEALTIVVTFPNDNAEVYKEVEQPEPVATRWIHYHCNEMGVMLTYDPAIEDMLGWTAADLLGDALLSIIHPDDAQESIDRWLSVITTDQPVRGRVRQRTKTGEWKWFEVTNTNFLATEGYVRCELFDVTAEVRMLHELTKQEEILRRLTEALPSGIVHFDRAGGLLFANHRLAEITGVVHGQLDDYLELFDPATQEDIQTMALNIYRDAIEVDMEATLYRDDGLVRHTRLAFRPLLVDENGAGGLLICVDDITESWNLRNALAKQAATDELTGVANRSSTHEALEAAMADRRSVGSGVIYFDLNGFKTANDELGHSHGDAMLVAFAERLSAAARETDTIGRVGGDEFIVVTPNTSEKQLAALAKRLLEAVNAPSPRFVMEAACGFTFIQHPETSGASGHQADRAGTERAINEADTAMYVHKRTPGPWPVQFHPSFLLSDEREAS